VLEELDVKNFALIDSSHVEFSKGFTVLSGETGAGKSILIGSLAFLLGGKGGTEQIRTGCHEASVSGIFSLESEEASQWLGEHGIESEENRILLRRVVKETGKSSSWIGGIPVTRSDLADFSAFLVDIHGQHEQQSLMKIADHRRYLDIYANLTDEVSAFTQIYDSLVEKRRRLENLKESAVNREEKIEMLNFAVTEIENAKLKPGEDEECESEEKKLSSFEKIYGDLENVCALFDGDESDGIVSALKKVSSSASKISGFDKNLENLENRLQSSFYEIDDIAGEFRRYKNEFVFDPERLNQVQERLEQISRLKKKYCGGRNGTIGEILLYAENAKKQLDDLGGENSDSHALEEEVSALEKKVYVAAKNLSVRRKNSAEKMAAEIEGILAKLGMKSTKFSVSIKEKSGDGFTQKCGPFGIDDIEFLISANPGSPLLPLAKIASGGELSRVMLALKTILSGADLAGTLVFDEIDTGIGGEIAVAVGEHLKKLALKKQILCITHLASIAVYADNQIKIQKGLEGDLTSTNVFSVSGGERVKEIARMLSGDSVSPQSLEHASLLLKKFGGENGGI
jgi:DNA repair protein RecN (Recombination protein N)